MIKCNTFVVQNKDSILNELNIGGVELSINDDGTLKTKDKDGNETTIGNSSSSNNGNAYGTLKHLEIEINDTTQTIFSTDEFQIFFDKDFKITDDENFSNENDVNSIQILNAGHYFISFNISLDMYSGRQTTVAGYIKSNINKEIVKKSISYNYFHTTKIGYGSITNSFIYDAEENEEITLHIQVNEGTANFYTVPSSTNFNIFRIE